MFNSQVCSVPRVVLSSFSSAKRVSSVRKVHTEVKIPVPWGHIAGKLWNKKDGKTPILAVHGWQDNANSFNTLIPLMSSKLPVLAIDLPGHGNSSHFPKGINYHRMSLLMSLKRIVEHYGWKNVSLMGHSLGGQTCFLYAAVYPDDVKNLVTLDIFAPTPLNAKKFVKYGGKAIDDFIRRDMQTQDGTPSYTLEKLVKMIIESPVGPKDEHAAQILLQRGAKSIGKGLYQLTRDPKLKGIPLAGWSNSEALRFCKGVKANVLCVKADSSPYFSTKEFFDEAWAQVSKSAKSADVRFIPGRHHVHLEDAENVAPIVNEFFDKYYC